MNSYPSKVLLFGEYTILLNGEGLAVPYPTYYMTWSTFHKMDERLLEFSKFLELHENTLRGVDVKSFKKCISEFDYLESSIPRDYGMGSSGAVCAAVYDRFGIDKRISLVDLRNVFQIMESFFHGRSSGIDPLISYVQKPLWFKNDHSIVEIPGFMSERNSSCTHYLIDSGLSRSSKPYIELFKERISVDKNKQRALKKVTDLNHHIIQKWIENDEEMIKKDWKELSLESYSLFEEMILPELKPMWMQGINTDGYFMKLCGAGGGGFYLALVEDEELFHKNFKSYRTVKL